MAVTAGGSTRANYSTANGQPGWPPCGVEVSITSLPCTLRCLSWRLGDISHACHRPRVQEIVSEASYHLLFLRRASTPWTSFGSKGSPLSAMRSRGSLCMSGMGAGELCEGPCSSVPALCVLASAHSRKYHCGFSRVLCAFVTVVIFVVPACACGVGRVDS